MKRLLIASMIFLAGEATAQTAAEIESSKLIPAHFAVCVTTGDASGRARVDSSWYLEDEARVRRADILREGWVAEGDESDREDAYPVHSIVKVTVDPTLLNQGLCLPPSTEGTVDPLAHDATDGQFAGAGHAIPSQFAVCVTTVDAKYARRDSFWSTDVDARTRRAEILRDGWLTSGDEPDREDLYPPHAIVKATIDDVTVNQPSCLPPD